VDLTNAKHADLIENLHQQSPFILKEMNKAVQLMEAASNEQVAESMHITLVLLASLMLLSGILFLYVRRYLMLPLLPLREALQTIAKGDLTKTLPSDNSGDEIGVLYTDYNEARHDFASMLKNVVESVEHLGVASLQLKEAATENASEMELQYQDIELISTAMTEMTATIKEVAGNTANASDYTKEADQYAHTGRQVMGDAAKTIGQLNNQVQDVGEVINALDADSKEISTVLDVINGIADQTNLLALNAAIEAARTAKSTSEIQQMIEKLQSQVQQSV
jgi:methyl-accepting chemotaxis protein